MKIEGREHVFIKVSTITTCLAPRALVEPILHLLFVSDFLHIVGEVDPTLHGLFSSKPGGALGLSVCPRSVPVNLLSRSIT